MKQNMKTFKSELILDYQPPKSSLPCLVTGLRVQSLTDAGIFQEDTSAREAGPSAFLCLIPLPENDNSGVRGFQKE